MAVAKDKMELRESWTFKQGRFRHIMDKQLSFSGKVEVIGAVNLPEKPDVLSNAKHFTLHCTDVRLSIGTQRKHDYQYGELSWCRLILYYSGTKATVTKQPLQGHEFRRVKQ